jgi:hypothetical protein
LAQTFIIVTFNELPKYQDELLHVGRHRQLFRFTRNLFDFSICL